MDLETNGTVSQICRKKKGRKEEKKKKKIPFKLSEILVGTNQNQRILFALIYNL